jgi:hypothetical protein
MKEISQQSRNDEPDMFSLCLLLTGNRSQGALIILGIEVPQMGAHHQTQFDFIMKTNALWSENGTSSWR